MEFTNDPQASVKQRAKMRKTESILILEEASFPPSARGVFTDSLDNIQAPRNTLAGAPSPATFAVDISLRRGRLAVLVFVVVGAIITTVRFFHEGYEIHRYPTKLESADQKRLLDTYNSYSGNIVSVFGKPIELFVTACVQVVLLRLVSASMLQSERNWRTVYGALALSASIGYLINNGFNSLNVQLVDSEIQSAVNTSDLYLDGVSFFARDRTTNVSHSVSENQPMNPITNTVLRNLVEPRAVRPKTVCAKEGTASVSKPFQMDTVEYGFPQRDWMKKLLPEALPPTTLALVMNATNGSANNGVKIEDLRMTASIAADLMIYSMILSKEVSPMGIHDAEFSPNDSSAKYNTSAAIRLGLLPSDPSSSETIQKQWFLDHVEGFFVSTRDSGSWVKKDDIPLNFSHVDISPNIYFDAVSIEVEMDPWYLQDHNNSQNGDRYMTGGANVATANYSNFSFSCDPWPARCVFLKRDGPIVSLTVNNEDLYYDTPSQIQAFSICLNEDGTESLQSTRDGSELDGYLNIRSCTSTSKTSVLLVSIGKRLMADALTQNTTANSSGIYPGGVATATNVRKIYSLTVGRLSWKSLDIAKAFGATCNIATDAGCEGLTLALTKTSKELSSQHLVVSADKLPIDELLPPQLNNVMRDHALRQRPLILVQVYEPTRPLNQVFWYDIIAGDILHPHNVRNVKWDLTQKSPGDMCVFEEERVQRVLDNHRYIEHPLQATYTAAVFFLFQNAVVKDSVVVTASNSNTTTLAFDGNTQYVALTASIPFANYLYTQLGCLILAVSIVISLIWTTVIHKSHRRPDPLTGITNADVMARAKLDDRSFPPFLLYRQVTLTSGSHVERREFDDFTINSLILQERAEGADQQRPTRSIDRGASHAA